jgi:ABC-type multidrug transport system fused ATPase/permease subunit
MYGHIDRYAQSTWYILLATQWMKFRLGVLGVAFTFCIAAGVAYFPGIDASLAGFALSFALNFASVAETTISKYTAMELDMNSMERVLEYIQLETESTAGDEAEPSWPSQGNIVFRDLEVAYGKDLPPVLKGLNFEVPSRHRIGIVGRTGSGKSSLTLALFRFLQVSKGCIEIDGVDLSSLKLHDVRSRLAIIPQDPVLFSGTLRSNLDPHGEHSDVSLLEVLERVSPTQTSSREGSQSRQSVFKNLQSTISRGGSNLSQGEKQLICLARAILTRPKILVLDEATSAVDMETDALIQRSIREEFRDSTVLVVAHRLSTVADFDKILVLSDGNIVEYDEPRALAQKKGSFWEMVKESGEDEALRHLLL